ncbi:hypothetical protein C7437_10291 [Psychrobacillus insolitus]|uniref:DUF2292 domain-containing protein n=1 Tax=Psychrobacillus insolitus TaxID=1461 RepID=A0A2W7MFL2_9BACI|nr:YezD family protein [Psychrobacillus insolitus]PZX05633.1 hypothetical protein C7437_10291 [Psychrobacillus insolitus]
MRIVDKKVQNHEQTLENLKEIIPTISYGTITLVIQDNYVVQIEKNEKFRLK